jgi:hypothetical protein
MNTVLTGVIVIVVALALVAAAVLAGRWLRRRMLDPPGVRSAARRCGRRAWRPRRCGRD